MAEEEKPEGEETEEEGGGGKKKLIIIIAAVLVVLLAGGGAAAFFLLGGEEEEVAEGEEVVEEEVVEEEVVEEPPIPAQYIALEPEFVISYQVGTRQRFLQVSVEVMTRQQTVVDAMELHSPMVRNEIIRIMSEHDFDNLRTPDGREALRQQLRDEVADIMKRESGNEGIEAVLFTNYVMQ